MCWFIRILFYGDDLVLMAESEELLMDMLRKWKKAINLNQVSKLSTSRVEFFFKFLFRDRQ